MSTKLRARTANIPRRDPAARQGLGLRLALALGLALGLVSAPTRAQAPALDGVWSASALRSDWNIGDWGAACGPQPSGGNEAGGSVTITAQGNELGITGLGRNYVTTQCWEQYPGLARVSHSSGTASWRTTCKTSSGDARQATVVTQLSGSGSRLNFDETGQYQFVIKGQNCTASVRRTRAFTRADPAAAPARSAAEKPKRAPRCETVGLPERLEVRPSRKLMRPGESFTFRSNVVDKAGCSVGVAPVFRVQSGDTHVELTSVGKITIADDAPEGEVRLQASVGDRALAVLVEIVSHERYDALLQQGSFDSEGESTEAAVAKIASNSLGSRSGVTEDNSRAKKVRLVAAIGALALAFGVLGLVLSRRSRRKTAAPVSQRVPPSSRAPAVGAPPYGKSCPTCRNEYATHEEFCAVDGNRLIALGSETAFGPTGGICPICGQGFDPGVAACPKHQEPLIPAALAAAGVRPSLGVRKICPVCGAQFSADSQFCGQCGAVLVPIN